MKELFVNKELAIQLQKIGFDLPCICGYDQFGNLRSKLANTNDGAIISWDKYDHHVPAPLYQQVIQWFESKNIYIQHLKSGATWYWCVYTDITTFNRTIDESIEYSIWHYNRQKS